MIRRALKRLGPGNVLRRFPVPSALLLAGAVLSLALAAATGDSEWYFSAWLALAFAAALATQLWARAQGGGESAYGPHVAASLAALGVGGLMALQLASGGGTRWPYLLQTHDLAFLFLAVAALFPVAPFLGPRFSIEAQWRFGLDVLLATAVGMTAWLAFGVGLLLAAGSAQFLFDAKPEGVLTSALHVALWLAAFLALGVLPDDAARVADEEVLSHGAVRLLLRFLNWVAVPLLLVHGALLNIYALKILLERELPRGGVGWMVGSFAFFGTLVWLLGQVPALRGRGGKLLQLFVRGWWWLLAAPFVLLVIGVWRRIADYGLTPPRYLLAEMAAWTAFALALWLWRGARASNRALILLAGALLLFGALAGPFSARNTSVHSQMARLHAMLADKGLLDAKERLAKTVPPGAWRDEERARASSIVSELLQLNADERLLALAGPALDAGRLREVKDEDRAVRHGRLRPLLEEALGLRGPGSRWRWMFIADLPLTTEVPAGMMLSGPYALGRPVLPVGRRWDGRVPGTRLHLALRDGEVLLTGPRGDVWRLQANTLLGMARRAGAKRQELGVEGARWIYARPVDIALPGGSRMVVKHFDLTECREQVPKNAQVSRCGISSIDFLLLLPGSYRANP